MKILDKIDEKSGKTSIFFGQMIGPLFILCTFALAPTHLLIFSLGVLGLFFSARFQIKGFFAALFLLSVAAVGEHLLSGAEHLWLLGLEGSYALAFFITALHADDYNYFVKNLLQQIEAKSSFIVNAEEEFAKSRAEGTQQQVLLQEKIDLLQKQIEEVLAEQSSLLILNEVLRKTTAQHIEEQVLLRGELSHLQDVSVRSLQAEQAAEEELRRLKNESALVQENQRLIDEINAARLDREQTHIINETLACLHAKESMRAEAIAEQKRQMEKDFEVQLQQTLSQYVPKEEFLQLEDKLKEQSAASVDLSAYVPREEFLQLEDKLKEQSAASVDLSAYVPREEFLQKTRALGNIELLHRQLKAQFEEKNEILHQTRKELFHADNALQTLQIEKGFQSEEISKEVLSELKSLEEEIVDLSEENEELHQLITFLSSPEDSMKRKKKVKVIPAQTYLF